MDKKNSELKEKEKRYNQIIQTKNDSLARGQKRNVKNNK